MSFKRARKRHWARVERKRRAGVRRMLGDHRRWAREGVQAVALGVMARTLAPFVGYWLRGPWAAEGE